MYRYQVIALPVASLKGIILAQFNCERKANDYLDNLDMTLYDVAEVVDVIEEGRDVEINRD